MDALAEEFTWAYFRPAGVIDIEAGMDAGHQITSWHHVNINSGGNAMETPYRSGSSRAPGGSVRSAAQAWVLSRAGGDCEYLCA